MVRFIFCWLCLVGSLLVSQPLQQDTEATRIQSNQPSSRVVWHMPRHHRHVALTFDDGPDEVVTPQLLAILRQKNVKATFFLVGHMISKCPHIVAQIIADGHHIANHTWAHYRLDEMDRAQVVAIIRHDSGYGPFEATHDAVCPTAGWAI